jgi:hypothetical protein
LGFINIDLALLNAAVKPTCPKAFKNCLVRPALPPDNLLMITTDISNKTLAARFKHMRDCD